MTTAHTQCCFHGSEEKAVPTPIKETKVEAKPAAPAPAPLPDEYCGSLCRQGEYLFDRMNTDPERLSAS